MKEYTLSETESIVKDELALGLKEVFRRGARQMLEVTLEWEVGQYIGKYRNLLDEKGHRLVIRNGYHKPRDLTTGIGKIPVKQPRVEGRREGQRFTSAIVAQVCASDLPASIR